VTHVVPLAERSCQSRGGAAARLKKAEVAALLRQLPDWTIQKGRLRRHLKLASFAAVVALISEVARVAEMEDHHPDFHVHYDEIDFELWTHVVAGLSENDFILAAKISELVARAS
jgi:4a-hydroxytetrahydrobiopterin dehydratase